MTRAKAPASTYRPGVDCAVCKNRRGFKARTCPGCGNRVLPPDEAAELLRARAEMAREAKR